MIDCGSRDESHKKAIAQLDYDDWFENLIEEEEAVDKLEKQGYSYLEALSLIKKNGLSNFKMEEL